MKTTKHIEAPERLALSVREVAKLLGISERHVWTLHSSGRLPAPVRLGRSVRWRADDIARWVALGCPHSREFENKRSPRGGTRRWPKERLRPVGVSLSNISILTGLIAVGIWPVAALSAAALLGLSLGIALRVLLAFEDVFTPPDGRAAGGAGWRIKVGVALNMLEPPAIAVALGLSLGRWMVPLSPGDAWETFAVWVVPAMLLAAGGESLWLGVRPERARQPLDSPPSIDS